MSEHGDELTTLARATLDARYGRTVSRRRRSRVIAVVAAAAVVTVTIAWVVWVGLFGTASSLDSRDLGYVEKGSHAVEVRYEVTVDRGDTVSCALQALSSDFGVVGWRVVDLPASETRTRQFRDVVRTTEPAVTGLIYRCWLT